MKSTGKKAKSNSSSVGWSGKEQFDPRREHLRETDPFFGPKLLLTEGASKSLSEFDVFSQRFFSSKPYTPLAEKDPETGDLVHKWKATAEPPARLRYVAYSAVNDLRNALDQAVTVSAAAINGRPANDAYFPFAESPADLDGMLGSKRYADIPDELKPFLRSLEPYPTGDSHEGGSDLLRALGKIANPNKHQVPLALGARNLEGVYQIRGLTATKLIGLGDPYWDSAKNEFIIGRTSHDGTLDYHLEMPLYIAFGDADPLTGYPVSGALRELLSIVDGIVLGIEAETERILRSRDS